MFFRPNDQDCLDANPPLSGRQDRRVESTVGNTPVPPDSRDPIRVDDPPASNPVFDPANSVYDDPPNNPLDSNLIDAESTTKAWEPAGFASPYGRSGNTAVNNHINSTLLSSLLLIIIIMIL